MKFFVWLRINDRFQPQLWADDFSDAERANHQAFTRLRTAAKHALTDEDQGKTIEELSVKYPPPAVEE